MKKLTGFITLVASLGIVTEACAGRDSIVVTVSAQAAPDYRRATLPDGAVRPEYYLIANGGMAPGTVRDPSCEMVPYEEIAGHVARHLRSQDYLLATTPEEADLFIMVQWGQTVGHGHDAYQMAVDHVGRALADVEPTSLRISRWMGMETSPAPAADPLAIGALEFAMAGIEIQNRMRNDANLANARLLGYVDEINDRRETHPAWSDFTGSVKELESDVEESRYYIVLRAYDMRQYLTWKKPVIRWATRISVGSQGTSFDERMAQMVASAASSFGDPTGFKRKYYGDPTVELGETRYLGTVSAPTGEAVRDATGAESRRN